MSDPIAPRQVGGPPRRVKSTGSSLVKGNRERGSGTRPVEDLPVVPDPERPVEDASPAFVAAPEQPATPGPHAEPLATEKPAADSVAQPQATPATPVAASVAPAPNPNKLVNATYRVPAELKQRLNSAISAAKTFEGWTSAEELVQDLFQREIARIESTYNDGQPFPIRTKAMPRGRSIDTMFRRDEA